jgi:hypothetical protein
MSAQQQVDSININGNSAPFSVYLDEDVYKLEQENYTVGRFGPT